MKKVSKCGVAAMTIAMCVKLLVDSNTNAMGQQLKRPNILWILTDQQRPDSLGCYGNKYTHILTPNIDSIAAQGTVFTNAFTNSPVCVPSRTSMLTSLYPNMNNEVLTNTDVIKDWPTDVLTFPQVFAQNGYKTANIGKVHTPKNDTWQYSEQVPPSFAVPTAKKVASFFSEKELEVIKAPKGIGSGIIFSAIEKPVNGVLKTQTIDTIDRSIKWLSENDDDSPFFLRVSILAPHAPFFAPEPFYSMYDVSQMEFDMPTEGEAKGAALYKSFTKEEIMRIRATYYGLASHVDAEIGRLIEYLKVTGRYDNTIIIYSSDHAHSMGEHAKFNKNHFYDEATRIPMIIKGPNVPSGEKRSYFIEGVDIGITLMNLAGIKPPHQFTTCGRDMFKVRQRDHVIGEISYQNYHQVYIKSKYYLMWFNYKNMTTEEKVIDEISINGSLFDLNKDPYCIYNVYNNPEYADIKARLSAQVLSELGITKTADQEISFKVNNKILKNDSPPVIINGRTLVSAKTVFEELGASVSWNPNIGIATIRRGATEVILETNRLIGHVNGMPHNLEVQAKVINNKLMVPVRFVAEQFGAEVKWNEEMRRITITLNDSSKSTPKSIKDDTDDI